MSFEAAYSFLFDGFAVVLDSDEIVYMGEDDGSFYLDIHGGDDRLYFTPENNQGEVKQVENGFVLNADDGRKYRIQRLKLA